MEAIFGRNLQSKNCVCAVNSPWLIALAINCKPDATFTSHDFITSSSDSDCLGMQLLLVAKAHSSTGWRMDDVCWSWDDNELEWIRTNWLSQREVEDGQTNPQNYGRRKEVIGRGRRFVKSWLVIGNELNKNNKPVEDANVDINKCFNLAADSPLINTQEMR